ncbi:hypothetical protein D9V87_05920 [Bacteroidetes/Chlorobi group bacterium MS-B_bin-24]|nr:MAG: hypothetical protein D9V87_05920 [Bacteroidetes/Chlorobi group bacterium MS-B_bin-24]
MSGCKKSFLLRNQFLRALSSCSADAGTSRFPPLPRHRRGKQAGKNSFPPTPFLFARPLGLRPEKFFGERRLVYF